MASNVAAFALVASEYEKTGDAILGFAPLFSPLLARHPGEIFDPASFAREFSSRYGLAMTPVIAQALSERLTQKGLLTATRDNGQTVYRCAENIENTLAVEESEVSELVTEFVQRSSRILGELNRPVSPEKLENAFLARLARPEFTAAFLIPEKARRNDRLLSLRTARAGKEWGDDQALDVLIADFILDLHERRPDRFAVLSTITYGALVADAVSAFAVPSAPPKADVNLRVVIDGPLLLDALDINAPEHRDYATGLLTQFKEAKLSITTFDHIVDEMRKTIRTTLDLFNRKEDTYGPFAARLRVSPGHALYATYIADALEDELKRLGVSVLRSAIYEEARFARYFPDKDVDSLRNALGDVHHHLERRITDARSVATVIRLKAENRSPSSILRAGTTFVTRNSALAKAVNRFLAKGHAEPDPRFACLTDGQIAGVIWFAGGMSGNLLSQKRLIANCATAMAPRLEIVAEMSKTLGRLGEDRRKQFETLMQDRRAALCPMRLTAGYAAAISEELATQTLAEMRAAVSEPLVAEVEQVAAQKVEEAKAREKAAEDEIHRVLSHSRSLQGELQEKEREARVSALELAEMRLNAERASDIAEQTNAELKQVRDRSLRALKAERGAIARRKERVVFGIRNGVRAIYLLVLLMSALPRYRSSSFIFYALIFFGIVGFWLFTPWFESLINRLAGLFVGSPEARLAQMAEALGFGSDWELQIALDEPDSDVPELSIP